MSTSQQVGGSAMRMVDYALAEVARGGFVYPLSERGKVPIFKRCRERATNDPYEVERIWRQHPQANIAALTGHRAGIVVVDFDNHGKVNGVETYRDELQHPRTWTIQTPRGFHKVFAYPQGKRVATKHAPGVDVLADNASHIVVGSVVSHGVYRWVKGLSPDDVPLVPYVEPGVVRAMREAKEANDARRARELVSFDGCRMGHPLAVHEMGTWLERLRDSSQRMVDLNRAAYSLGGWVASGCLDVSEVRTGLFMASQQNGLAQKRGEPAVESAINAGLLAGAAAPRAVPLSPAQVETAPPQEKPAAFMDAYDLALSIADEMEREGPRPVIPTGIADLDDALDGGVQFGGLAIGIGAPGNGKTTVLQQTSNNCIENDLAPVLFYSVELSARDWMSKMATSVYDASWSRIFRGLHPQAVRELATQRLKGARLRVVDRTHVPYVDDLADEIKRVSDKYGELPIVPVDYLQYCRTRKDYSSPREHANAVSQMLADLANMAGVAILSASSTARTASHRDDMDPDVNNVIHMAKESGGIEFDASVVFGLFFERPSRETRHLPRYGWLKVGKGRRDGAAGAFPIVMHGRRGVIASCSEDDVRRALAGSVSSGCADGPADKVLRLLRSNMGRPLSQNEIVKATNLSRRKVREVLDMSARHGLAEGERGWSLQGKE